jgi:hypothetical protein
MFNLGDKVVSKRTGCPVVGTIIAIESGETYKNTFYNTHHVMMKYWFGLYPYWDTKLVYTVSFTEPQRIGTLEEFVAQSNELFAQRFIEVDLKQLYEVAAPMSKFAQYPEEDLELFEEAHVSSN